MKKYVLAFSLLLCTTLLFAQQNTLVPITIDEATFSNASLYHYAKVSRQMDALLINKAIKVYKNEALSESVTADEFLKSTNFPFMRQIINPQNPEDPYDLIDTVIHTSMPLANASYLEWSSTFVRFNTPIKEGNMDFYLSRKELEKALGEQLSSYSLLVYLSEKFGKINSKTIASNSSRVLNGLAAKLYDTQGLSLYSNSRLSKKMGANELNKSTVHNWGNTETRYNYFPANRDSIAGLIFAIEIEMEKDEFELENFSVSPTYYSGAFQGNNPWYWSPISEVKKRFTEEEWQVLMVVQYYALSKTLYPVFEYMGN